MSFAQGSGPPASAKQLSYLLALVQAAGHDSFRDARYPLGLTQRQAGGKFSIKEASELIEQLTSTSVDRDDAAPTGPARTSQQRAESSARAAASEVKAEREAERAAARLAYRQAEVLGGIPADMLAVELERRGWTCSPPD